jgi:hypothetical protein
VFLVFWARDEEETCAYTSEIEAGLAARRERYSIRKWEVRDKFEEGTKDDIK